MIKVALRLIRQNNVYRFDLIPKIKVTCVVDSCDSEREGIAANRWMWLHDAFLQFLVGIAFNAHLHTNTHAHTYTRTRACA
jgi:hypothetical protein